MDYHSTGDKQTDLIYADFFLVEVVLRFWEKTFLAGNTTKRESGLTIKMPEYSLFFAILYNKNYYFAYLSNFNIDNQNIELESTMSVSWKLLEASIL